jgi:hypothetical protein
MGVLRVDVCLLAHPVRGPRLLEHDHPFFYERDHDGLPRGWIRRMKAPMTRLIPRFSGERTVREYATVLCGSAAGPIR